MKKVSINCTAFIQALEYVKKVMEKHALVPIIEEYLLTIQGNSLRITGTDLQSTLSMTIDSLHVKNHGEDFQCILTPESLKYFKKLEKHEPLTLEYDVETYSLNFSTNSDKAKYSGDDVTCFPIAPIVTDFIFTLPGEALAELPDLLNYVGQDDLRPAMTGIYFGTHEVKFYTCATDGHTLKTVNVPSLDNSNDPENQLFILPAKPAKLLGDSKVTNDVAVFVRTEHGTIINMKFTFIDPKTGNAVELITKSIDEKYPQYFEVIPAANVATTSYTIDQKLFNKQLDKAELFANKVTRQVVISLNGANKIKAEDLDFSNEYEGHIGGTYQGNPLEIGFNAKYLRRLVQSFGDSPVMEMREPNKAGVIRQGNVVALCMPVMIENK